MINGIMDFKKLLEVKQSAALKAILPDGTKADMSCSLDVTDNTATFYLANAEDKPTDVAGFMWTIDCERDDECWDGHKHDDLFEGDNDFYYCGVDIVDDRDNIYNVMSIKDCGDEVIFVLQDQGGHYCEKAYDEENDFTGYPVTDEATRLREMLTNALEYLENADFLNSRSEIIEEVFGSTQTELVNLGVLDEDYEEEYRIDEFEVNA